MPLLLRQTAFLLLCSALALPITSPAQTRTDAPPKAQTSGHWRQLSARSKVALAPLAERWDELSDTQRSKWQAIARNFHQLSEAEQQTMQARMREWVALSPTQRNQARLNFNSLQNVSKDQKKNRWDEYQSLSEDEKRKLSAGSLAPAKTTAPSAKPVAAERLVQPTVRSVPSAALPVRQPIDPNTLLPVPPTPAAAPVETPVAPQAEPEASAS